MWNWPKKIDLFPCAKSNDYVARELLGLFIPQRICQTVVQRWKHVSLCSTNFAASLWAERTCESLLSSSTICTGRPTTHEVASVASLTLGLTPWGLNVTDASVNPKKSTSPYKAASDRIRTLSKTSKPTQTQTLTKINLGKLVQNNPVIQKRSDWLYFRGSLKKSLLKPSKYSSTALQKKELVKYSWPESSLRRWVG